ncbi:MAG: KilA-N domain-containing protein, partial [Christensenellaceae bacterium]|nr:KilA-N domain-containing protein [Christensenellaceae bacterium]
MKNNKIKVNEIDISYRDRNGENYISLTDIAKIKNAEHPAEIVRNWLRTRMAVEFLGVW